MGISLSSTDNEIKIAYREMSKKWHPDIHDDIDTTEKMQDINEAYAILKDHEKRKRYDTEYERFRKVFQEDAVNSKQSNNMAHTQSNWYYNYNVQDEELKQDINNAHKYAEDLVNEFIKELKKTSKIAVEGAMTNVHRYEVSWALGGILLFIMTSLFKSCG